MVWNNHLTKRLAGDTPPIEWERLIIRINPLLNKKIIDKVELTAFVAKGHRTGRWLLNRNDPEYCTKIEAFNTAKKLIFLILNSKNGVGVNQIQDDFPEEYFKKEITKCPICKKEITLTDFDKNAKKDPLSIQIGHDIPLSRTLNQHNSKNVFWIHRKCNFLKGERTVNETMLDFLDIIKTHVISK